MTKIRVWLSADGYRDADDNLGLLIGAALARSVTRVSDDVRVGGFVFGDTKDGGQYRMLQPSGKLPKGFDDGDPRFDDAFAGRVAAGNHAFYRKYADKAIKQLAPAWERHDLLAEDPTGREAWNYDAGRKAEMTRAGWSLAQDIRQAIAAGGRDAPNEVVVYSAGGGAHVAAEAIGYLRNQGVAQDKLVRHFAVVQHGDTNWWSNQEPQATKITRPFTIVISEQDPSRYDDGSAGPGLKWLVRNGKWLEGDRFGKAFAEAIAVAQGVDPFEKLGTRPIFRTTTDGSDAGSHAFALDGDDLLDAWDNRLRKGENVAWNAEHLIDTGDGFRRRVIYDDFDWRDVGALLNGTAHGVDLI
jgi:hypothetical protein